MIKRRNEAISSDEISSVQVLKGKILDDVIVILLYHSTEIASVCMVTAKASSSRC